MVSSMITKLGCVLVFCMVVVAPPYAAEAAVTCGLVSSKVGPCLGYLGGGAGPTTACCTAIKQLNMAATTASDRKQTCVCLKAAAGSIKNLDYSKAAGLPNKCGVNIPYPISTRTNCNAIH